MIINLKASYPSIHKLPIIQSVDTDIFDYTYYMKCTQCSFCNDQCCSYGADIDMQNVNRILKYGDELEKFTGIPKSAWFDDDEKSWDHEYPGNDFTRTSYVKEKDSCVFLNRENRGCMIHSFTEMKGMDYHLLKPFVCTLFPVTCDEGVLCPSEEVEDGTLVCLGDGLSLYKGARNEIKYYFGENLVAELDEIEESHNAGKKLTA